MAMLGFTPLNPSRLAFPLYNFARVIVAGTKGS